MVLAGAGGHGRVVLDALLAQGTYDIVGFVDPDESHWGAAIDGVHVLGGDDRLIALPQDVLFVVTVGSIGDTAPRWRVFERLVAAGRRPATIVHPDASVSPRAAIGDGSVVLAQAVVAAGASIGRNVIVNNGAIVEHECLVEDHVHLATGSRLAGNVRVGAGAHVGIGACVRQGIAIGERAVVAAGAAVIEDVPMGERVGGVPAQQISGARSQV